MLELFLALAIGIALGIGAGLVPGIHPNNTIPVIAGLSFLFSPLSAAVILISSGVVNSFVSMIPSILLGAPEDADALGVLPGHKLLLEGRGFEAIKLTVIGSLGGMVFGIGLLPIFYFVLPILYTYVKPVTHWLLIFVVTYMVVSERGIKEDLFAVLVIFLSGFIGLTVLDYSDMMIFPLLAGLFGLPMLVISLFEKTKFPEKITMDEEKIKRKRLFSSIGAGSMAGIITGLLPGVGSAQATILAQQVSGSNGGGRDFLISIGAVTTTNVIFSLLALWLIGRPRSGIAVAVADLLEMNFQYVLIFLCVIALSSAVATIATLKLTNPVLKILKKVNYFLLNLTIIIVILITVFIFSSFFGMLVCLVALAVGLIPNFVNIKRTHCMGCLVIPIIFYYMGINLI